MKKFATMIFATLLFEMVEIVIILFLRVFPCIVILNYIILNVFLNCAESDY